MTAHDYTITARRVGFLNWIAYTFPTGLGTRSISASGLTRTLAIVSLQRRIRWYQDNGLKVGALP